MSDRVFPKGADERIRRFQPPCGDVDVERGVQDAQEPRDGTGVFAGERERRTEAPRQEFAAERLAEGIARQSVEVHGFFDVVRQPALALECIVKEGCRVGGLDQRRRTEGAVAETVSHTGFARVEVRVLDVLAPPNRE